MRIWNVLGMVAVGFFLSCGGDKKPTGLEETSNPISAKPVRYLASQNFQVTQDAELGLLTIAKPILICNGAEASTVDSILWSFQYQISKGTLYLWDSLQCTGLKFGGGNTSLVGNWEFMDTLVFPIEDWDSRVSPSCESVTTEPWENVSMDFSTSSVTVLGIQDSFCLVDDSPVMQDLKKKGFKGATLTKKDCKTFTAEINGHSATFEILTFDPVTNARSTVFTFEGKPCTEEIPAQATECSSTAQDPLKAAEFTLCVMNSGFLTADSTSP